jgi:von Willebrand factor A domain-containing protein 8
MRKAGIGEANVDPPGHINMSVTPDHVLIGDLCVKRSVPENIEKVPRPLFYDNSAHRFALELMLRTHISDRYNSTLLIGNQGVGKNKLVDQMLHMLRREREYIQLHRDSTVQSLTMIPSLQDGRVIFEDSPLLRAAKTGRVLVIDEADKAPIEVLCLLKMLAEDGELILHDGRRLLSQQRILHEFPEGSSSNTIIPIDPEFRLIVLANRPGYPFHGNNLFRECGDIFSVQVIENLDLSSEVTLLNAYGPNVPVDTIKRIALAFQDLRSMYENHELSYPYSAREAVSVIKHIQSFPEDGAAAAVENILGFEGYNPRSRKTIALVFQSRGIPVPVEQNLSALPTNRLELIQSMIQIAPSVPIPEPVSYKASLLASNSDSPLTPCGVTTRALVIKPWTSNSFSVRSFPIHPARVFSFR